MCIMFCALSCKAGVTWKQDSSNNMFCTYIFPFSFAFPPVPLVLKEVQQSLSLAIADEDDSVEGLFQHCFLSSVFFVFSPSFLHSASPFLFLPLCFSPFSSVFFLPLLSSSSSCLPLLFLFLLVLSPFLFFFCCCSIPHLAFIARGCMLYGNGRHASRRRGTSAARRASP